MEFICVTIPSFRDGAVQVLLETVYTCLTNRKIENVRPKNDEDLIPPFARSTAVQVPRADALTFAGDALRNRIIRIG
jgi:hypothetical protein